MLITIIICIIIAYLATRVNACNSHVPRILTYKRRGLINYFRFSNALQTLTSDILINGKNRERIQGCSPVLLQHIVCRVAYRLGY